jgi:hypothetical protein
MKDLWLNTYLSCQDVSICKLACYVHRPQWFLITEVLRARYAFSKWCTFSTHLPKLDPSKELSVCDYKRKINSRINHLIDCEILQLLSGVIFFWSLSSQYMISLMWLPTASYVSWEATCSFGTSPCRFYLSWNSQRMYLAYEAHDMPLQSSNLICIGYNITYIRCEPWFFSPFFFFFLISSYWQFFLQKNHKLIQIHTRKSKVWELYFLREKNTGADPLLVPCIQQICREFHRKVKQPSVLISKIC